MEKERGGDRGKVWVLIWIGKMRNLDELDIVFQKLETLEDQKREAEIAKLRSKITKSYVINTVLAALMYIALKKSK